MNAHTVNAQKEAVKWLSSESQHIESQPSESQPICAQNECQAYGVRRCRKAIPKIRHVSKIFLRGRRRNSFMAKLCESGHPAFRTTRERLCATRHREVSRINAGIVASVSLCLFSNHLPLSRFMGISAKCPRFHWGVWNWLYLPQLGSKTVGFNSV
jgi:hypothetical protein